MEKSEGRQPDPVSALALLLPSYKTPLLAAELLHAASSCMASYAGVQFVLLLDLRDPFIGAYKELVESVKGKGLSVGYFVFDGTPYCGQVNRIAPILRADCLCVIDGTHMPAADRPIAEVVSAWRASNPQEMRVGTFDDSGLYPVVTRKLVDRLGYMFHPLAYGRLEAEEWLLMLGDHLGILSPIPGGKIIESPAQGVELIGFSEPHDSEWVGRTLAQTLTDESDRLSEFLVG